MANANEPALIGITSYARDTRYINNGIGVSFGNLTQEQASRLIEITSQYFAPIRAQRISQAINSGVGVDNETNIITLGVDDILEGKVFTDLLLDIGEYVVEQNMQIFRSNLSTRNIDHLQYAKIISGRLGRYKLRWREIVNFFTKCFPCCEGCCNQEQQYNLNSQLNVHNTPRTSA